MTKAERHGALRETLITLGQEAVSQHGLSGLKARDIARQAGCALGAIYLVFPDLDALILAINDRTLSAVDAAIRASLACEGAPATDLTPVRQLTLLAHAYLDYAVAHPRRWAALFTHTLPAGRTVPDAYRAHQAHLFAYVEAPLAALRPDLAAAALALTARAIFSAVHGIIALGVDQKLSPMPLDSLRGQLCTLVTAIAMGLQAIGPGDASGRA
jgi:AcrR family transcriptional regulator